MAVEIDGRKFEKRDGKIFEIEEREIDLDRLQKDIDRLKRIVNNAPQPKEVPEDASEDAKEAINFWNDNMTEEPLQEEKKKELRRKKNLLKRLKSL